MNQSLGRRIHVFVCRWRWLDDGEIDNFLRASGTNREGMVHFVCCSYDGRAPDLITKLVDADKYMWAKDKNKTWYKNCRKQFTVGKNFKIHNLR